MEWNGLDWTWTCIPGVMQLFVKLALFVKFDVVADQQPEVINSIPLQSTGQVGIHNSQLSTASIALHSVGVSVTLMS